MSNGNVQAVQELYEAFGRQDIPAILERLQEDVEWDTHLPNRPEAPPWLRPRRGRDEAQGFFQAVGEELEFETFEPYAFPADGPYVVALIRLAVVVRKTGARVETDPHAHVWEFGEDGQVRSLRHLADTRAHYEAWQGS